MRKSRSEKEIASIIRQGPAISVGKQDITVVHKAFLSQSHVKTLISSTQKWRAKCGLLELFYSSLSLIS